MKNVRIYQTGDYEIGDVVTLSPSAAQHVGLVLRMTVGEQITLFPGNNSEYTATLCELQKKIIKARIENRSSVNRESPRTIHLAQAIAKGEKMEWVIQKAVELGVSSITPLLTERCVVRLDQERLLKKQQQWQAIAIAACEQCGRNIVPTIYASVSLERYLDTCTADYQLILSPLATTSWPTITNASAEIALLIGPEGGFTEQEIQNYRQQTHTVRLGPRILRTETAALTALSILQMRYGDL